MNDTSYLAHIARYSVWLGCFLTINLSLAQVKNVLQAPPNERSAQLWLLTDKIGLDSTRLFMSYDSIQSVSESIDDKLLYWYAGLLKMNFQQVFRYSSFSQRISMLKREQAYFEQSPYPIIRATFYFILSNAHFKNLDFTEAFKASFRARQIFEQIGYQNIPEASLFLDNFFGFYYFFEDYRTAIEFSKLAETYNRHNLLNTAFIVNNRGVAYLKLQDYPNAQKTFLKTIAIAKAKKR